MSRTSQRVGQGVRDAADRPRRLQAQVPEGRQARRGRPVAPGARAGPRRQGRADLPHVLGRAGDADGRGSFRFYRKQPGTNAKGMVHSSYFIRGYAIHGYKSVPTHNASHGCLRVPIPNALSIFRWINDGRPHLRLPLARGAHMLIAGVVCLVLAAAAGGWRVVVSTASIEELPPSRPARAVTCASWPTRSPCPRAAARSASAASWRARRRPAYVGTVKAPQTGQECVWYRTKVTHEYYDYECGPSDTDRPRARAARSRAR